MEISPNTYKSTISKTLVSIVLLCIAFTHFGWGQAVNGTLDATHLNFYEDATVRLDGKWEFYWGKLLEPKAEEFSKGQKQYHPIENTWGKYPSSAPSDGSGYATYRLNLYLPDSLPALSLRIPDFYTAYRLYVNGQLVSDNGTVGKDKASTTPFWDPTSKIVDIRSGKNEIILQIANFHHKKGGGHTGLTLTSANEASYLDNLTNSSTLFVFGAFLVTGIFSLTIFFFNQKDKAFLFFSLFSFFYLYRLIGADTYIIHDLLKNYSWNFFIRLEYASLFLSVAAFAYYIWHIYKLRFKLIFVHLVGIASGLMMLGLLFPPLTFTKALPYYLIFVALAYLVALVTIIVKSRINSVEKASQFTSLLAIGLILVFHITGYFEYNGALLWVNFLGYTIFICSSSISLGWRFGHNFKATTAAGEVAAKTQQDFLNTVSHELRTPMNAILGMSDFLLDSELKPNQKEKVETIKSNGESLNNILLDVLSFSEMGSGDIRLEKQVMSVRECVDVAVELTHKYIKAKDININIDVSNNIPEKVIGDPARVKQIFVHLLSNAFKFTERGNVSLKGYLEAEDKDYLTLRFEVKDTGIGIKKSKLNSIFDAFSQIESGNTRQFGGTGLGLTITRQLVQLMDGTITIESEVDKGTEIDMTLDFKRVKVSAKGSLRQAIQQNDELNTGLRILYAEDNPINQKLLVMMLKSMGIDIATAENGKEAWQMAVSKQYDIILMDIQMPEMDGIEATKNIVRDAPHRPIIIAVTANAGAADKKRAIGAGMNDFIAKPIKADTLKQTLIKWQGIHDFFGEDGYV